MSGTATKTWSGFDVKISDKAREVFNKALDGVTGISYNPVAVATQVISGVDYCFFCSTETSQQYALIEINESVNGRIELMGVKFWAKE